MKVTINYTYEIPQVTLDIANEYNFDLDKLRTHMEIERITVEEANDPCFMDERILTWMECWEPTRLW